MLQLLQEKEKKKTIVFVFLHERVKSPLGLMQLSLRLSKQKFHSVASKAKKMNQFRDFRVSVLMNAICPSGHNLS